ncbi:TPA: hypothetical protein DCL30_02815 [Candidatus Peribacteria bacterium]|nr:hypothetical protein [Candidatus Peribacteria bacterium]HAS34163.1 hypothetical protein [Candidatus Peribacteria bacterium]
MPMRQNSKRVYWLLGAASIPFLVKIAVLSLGVSGYLLQSLYKVFQLIVPGVWRYRDGKTGARIVWPTDEPRPSAVLWIMATLIALVLSLSAIVALQLLIPLFHLDPETLRRGLDARFAVGPVGAVAVVVFLSFLNSALEELHFRAWLDRELSRSTGDTIGIITSASLFGLMHGLIFLGLPDVPTSLIPLAIIGLAIGGICWSLLLRKSGGIYAAWWSHGLTDALLLGWGLSWLGYL